jgi:uncharacterized protein
MMPFYYGFDPLYLLMVAPAMLLALYAQWKVRSAMGKWGRVANTSGLSGAAAARRILDQAGLHDVRVEQTGGLLTDHYDPRTRVLRLSPQVYQVNSVAAVGIAAHEAGHALQHANRYAPLQLRNAIVPTAQVGSWLSFPLILIGAVMMRAAHASPLGFWIAVAGVGLFGLTVVFQMITLPVEFDASRRAKKLIADLGIIQVREEADGVAAVLNAAALTYVAATITALLTLLYWLMRLGLLGGRRN